MTQTFGFDVCFTFYRVVFYAPMKAENWKLVTEMIINKSSLMRVSQYRWLQFIIIIIIIIINIIMAEKTLRKIIFLLRLCSNRSMEVTVM